MRKATRILSLLLALILCLSLLPLSALAVEEATESDEIVEDVLDVETGDPVQDVSEPTALEEEHVQDVESSDEEQLMDILPDFAIDGADTVAVTRAEWISALVDTFSMTVDEDNYPDNYYTDISDADEYYRDIMVAVEFGVVDLEYGTPFEPDGAATREFTASTLVYCLGFVDEGDTTYTYSDAVTDAFAAQVAVDQGWFALVGGKFLPDQAITAAEMDSMLADAESILADDVIENHTETNAVFADGVVEFPVGTEVEVTEDNKLIIYDTATTLHTGDTFVIYFGTLPIACIALAITESSTYRLISYTTDGTEDAIISLVCEGSYVPTLVETDSSNIQSDITLDGAAVTEIEATLFSPEKGVIESTADIFVFPELDGASTSLKDIKGTYNGKFADIYKAKISTKMTNVVLNYDINTKANRYEVYITCDTELTFTLGTSLSALSLDNKTGSIAITEVNFGPIGSVGVYFEYDLSGEFSCVWTGKTTFGIAVNGDDYRIIKDFTRKSFDSFAQVNVQAGVAAMFSLKIASSAFTLKAAIGFQGTYLHAEYSTGSPMVCDDYQAWLYAYLYAYAKIPYKKAFSKTIDIYTKNSSPIRVHYHKEYGKWVESCTREKDFAAQTGKVPSNYFTSSSSKYYNTGSKDYVTTPVIVWSYSLDEDNNATITKYQGNASTLRIPETIDGYTITAIGNGAFQNNKSLYSVVVSNTVTSIGNSAFSGCTSLTVIDLPDSITSIGNYAFQNTGLLSLELPAYLERIGDRFLC